MGSFIQVLSFCSVNIANSFRIRDGPDPSQLVRTKTIMSCEKVKCVASDG